jgi:hypothetical protein
MLLDRFEITAAYDTVEILFYVSTAASVVDDLGSEAEGATAVREIHQKMSFFRLDKARLPPPLTVANATRSALAALSQTPPADHASASAAGAGGSGSGSGNGVDPLTANLGSRVGSNGTGWAGSGRGTFTVAGWATVAGDRRVPQDIIGSAILTTPPGADGRASSYDPVSVKFPVGHDG